ncbi:MAG TPA: 4-hydroxy-3-methylbut-2-enyl diphosphate reductase [Chthoniobacteraceae bacterium]|jgi:4-hydroxy-3-methylbut-2-enyl diphosphate reductase|nr:4-hydroxy-3-methylbut-2-enyl diphosphate reductase [Chthoniobacteraceae bacterium]
MIIHIAEHFGVCFGVRDALALAERIAAENEPLTILGELVHNPIARERLGRLGVREESLDAAPQAVTRRVLITAHGASDAARARWRSSGHAVEDATCPLVRHAHRQLRQLVEEGCFPVIIGKHGHVEVLGLAGDFPGAAILETEADIASIPEAPHYGVVSQTTQPVDRALRLVVALRAARPHSRVRFVDTVCRPTKDRQQALRELIRKVQVVIVVGGRNSNNTRELAETVRAAGLPAYHIERAAELCWEWIAGFEHVGITGGTSTLPETVEQVRSRLAEMAAQRREAA